MSGETLIALFTSLPMWVTIVPIFICSVISAAAIIERFLFFRKIDHDYRAIVQNIINLVRGGNTGEAGRFCDAYPGPLVDIARSVAGNMKREDREGLILGSSRSAIAALERNVGIIATIATVSPLLGLFGTVTGLLKSFVALYRGGPDASALLSYGVAEALLTTILGLLVAIPSWIFYNYMVSRVEFYIREAEYISNSMTIL
jgi:biopolymer transport protein ExbB